MPHPQANELHVSSLQHELLERMVHRSTNAQRLVKRGRIILEAAEGVSNSKIAQHLQMGYETVRRWRDRWHMAQAHLEAIEATAKPKLLGQAIEVLLTDEKRPGAPETFTFEQFMQIMALACETPGESQRPVSSWTPRELADEAVKRGIVKQISPRTVGRFLKGERFAASSQALLAHATSRRSS
ncbi:helix-turn-helix domain-containing protein [Ktedonobacteria bacterium brp13]|nr:helix-turn-helix domain-containing protein [Ktedonobacteria bacterium brp13]BCL79466.1 helix-turn-helix domain-containing protein [Ktedonobacteria bacterium brp13]BCL82367.1 helix-turn-helix domain-containing protein [Ktedonobacteria bacterium brp13]BCL83683.1 helix-turn-helix domain-containing protein [Ktedonobacteria bacterium brp13]BCL84701.1 helix-turn-helix domain-containing protein [Ktedonobacteria bacterium brp13]